MIPMLDIRPYVTMPLFDLDNVWRRVIDGYAPAARLYARHYSYYAYRDNRRSDPNYANRFLIVGPGEKHLLMTPEDDALFVWRKFINDSGQAGVNCAVFRNESKYLSSWLIEQASRIAWARWPGARLYTYINPRAIKSTNPGYCFFMAGWQKCGVTKVNKLVILERYPDLGKQ